MENAPRLAPCILVIDDSEPNRRLVRETLQDEGFRVLEAVDGETGVAAFEAHRPDCVVMDLRMPGLNGLGSMERIRSLPGGAETPILVLTALRDLDSFDAAQRIGVEDFLTKPIRPSELVARVNTALRLRQMNRELGEAYLLVRRQRDALIRLQLQQEQITSFIVHDLKNPVNNIELLAQMMEDDRTLSAESHESVAAMHKEVRVMLRLIYDLLDIRRAESEMMSVLRTEVRVAELFESAVEDHRERARFHEVELRMTCEVDVIRGDQDLLRRLLSNLIENALRHAPLKSTLRLQASPVDGAVLLRVADAGAGVPVELREQIFEKFVQLSPGSQGVNRRGRGLGLAFCKMVAQAHGGSIWVEDGQPGAVFCVRIPDA